ncbi:hypothetical protein BDZ89DRAFT_593109 [Hymenopellis radicata]|nr:hypothetical protein BDZ89DRAFT_593109 [Hymenopellis radicata]
MRSRSENTVRDHTATPERRTVTPLTSRLPLSPIKYADNTFRPDTFTPIQSTPLFPTQHGDTGKQKNCFGYGYDYPTPSDNRAAKKRRFDASGASTPTAFVPTPATTRRKKTKTSLFNPTPSTSTAASFTLPLPSYIPSTSDKDLPLEHRLWLMDKRAKELGFGTLGELFFQIFRDPDEGEKQTWGDVEKDCFLSRSNATSKFLRGECARTPADIMQLWWTSPYGARHRDCPEMFSSRAALLYTTIRPVRPAMSSFAMQIVEERVVEQARTAVKPESGLHVHIPTKKRPVKAGVEVVDWRRLGKETHSTVARLHRRHQPILWALLTAAATPAAYKGKSSRENRPIDLVVSTAISKVTFCRSPHARLGPILEGLFNIASNASFDTFRYDSRVGNTPAYDTMLRILYGLSQQAAVQTLEICRDPGRWYWIVIDNVQNYFRRRSLGIGRENYMVIGMAGTVWVALMAGPGPEALNFEKKALMRKEFSRQSVTTGQLLALLPQEHEHRVFSYQWLWVLGNYDHRLAHLKTRANELLRTKGRLQKVPDGRTECFPLPSNNGRETQLPEFQASLFDFFKSAGQTEQRFHRRLMPVTGDGFTFELLLKLMQQRQFHESDFESLRFLEPGLAGWHTEWTNDSRVIDYHLDSYSSQDPSTLGYALSKIKRKIPKDQGKYNYHHANEALYLVLDMRMLDCWRLFLLDIARERDVDTSAHNDIFDVITILDEASKLPTLLEFERYAERIHDMYTTESAIYNAANGTKGVTAPKASRVPQPPISLVDRLAAADLNAPPVEEFTGDVFLSRSMGFMRETIRSRECVWGISEGDVGRAWAQFKTMMFCFAGSSHKKYAQYLLESIINLEFESTPELRAALLSTGVATLSGLPGTHACVDLLQERFQRILEAVVQHKGLEYGARFIREGISRHLGHFQRLKEEFLTGVGLERHGKRRSKPSVDAEGRIMLRDLKSVELHSHTSGRRKDAEDTYRSQFVLGITTSTGGWLQRTTMRMDLLRESNGLDPLDAKVLDGDEDEGAEPEDSGRNNTGTVESVGFQVVDGGNILREEVSVVNIARTLIEIMDGGGEEEEDDDMDCD